ncbi:hypothetical protein Trydic_g18347 [Trypoxylus dichotomus]
MSAKNSSPEFRRRSKFLMSLENSLVQEYVSRRKDVNSLPREIRKHCIDMKEAPGSSGLTIEERQKEECIMWNILSKERSGGKGSISNV